MSDIMMRYFQEGGRVTVTTFTNSGIAPGQVLPANRLRYALILPASTATRVIWHLGESWPNNTIGWISTVTSGSTVMTEDEIGELIRLPLWVWVDSSVTMEVHEASYDPTRYAQMMRYVNEQLSKPSAS